MIYKDPPARRNPGYPNPPFRLGPSGGPSFIIEEDEK